MANDGAVVMLDNGLWAQLRRIPVFGPLGTTIVVAMELDPETQRRLNAQPAAPLEALPSPASR